MLVASKPAAAILALLAMPDIVLAGDEKGWPNAVPAVSCAVLACCGAVLVFRAIAERLGALPAVCGAMWLSGAAMFADRPLELVAWPWPSSSLAMVAAVAAYSWILKHEAKHHPKFAAFAAFGILWPLSDFVADGAAVAVLGAAGTATMILVALASVPRYTRGFS